MKAQIDGNLWKGCSTCGEEVATSVCRRCGRPISVGGHFHHGLCKSCARTRGKLK